MNCSKCGKEIKDEWRFCNFCGEEIIRKEKVASQENIKENLSKERKKEPMKNKYSTFETVLDVISAIFMVIGICSNLLMFLWAIFTMVFAIVCKKIGESKGLDYGFLIGWFFGILGLIIMCVLPNEKDNQNVSSNKYEDLSKLQELKVRGVITEEEFEKEKSKLLN